VGEPVEPRPNVTIDLLDYKHLIDKVLLTGTGSGKTAAYTLRAVEAFRREIVLLEESHRSGDFSELFLQLRKPPARSYPEIRTDDVLVDQARVRAGRTRAWFSLCADDAGRWSALGPIVSRAAQDLARRPVGDVLATLPVVPSAIVSLPDRARLIVPEKLVREMLAGMRGFLDCIKTALCLLLAVLPRLIDGIAFVLVVIAVCLRYGRRQDSPSDAFLLIRRFDPSAGTKTSSLPSAC
jgi:hypothetical protein